MPELQQTAILLNLLNRAFKLLLVFVPERFLQNMTLAHLVHRRAVVHLDVLTFLCDRRPHVFKLVRDLVLRLIWIVSLLGLNYGLDLLPHESENDV